MPCVCAVCAVCGFVKCAHMCAPNPHPPPIINWLPTHRHSRVSLLILWCGEAAVSYQEVAHISGRIPGQESIEHSLKCHKGCLPAVLLSHLHLLHPLLPLLIAPGGFVRVYREGKKGRRGREERDGGRGEEREGREFITRLISSLP